MKYFGALVFFVWLTVASANTVDLVVFSDPAYHQRYQQLITELRCPKCQNQNLADSNAPISLDLRAQIQQLLEKGLSNHEIEQYLTQRYSEFILYRPEVNQKTYLLWLSPLLILGVGFFTVLSLSGRSVKIKNAHTSGMPDQQQVADLLDDGGQ
ncbi:MAG: cytochrome c-type biogenesis protein CcmH [Porticoccaceae bacterium]|nr:cytochrome c-type biogenesis protein CcmH [Porticoccaceae bacterium]MDG1474738.1 cytochrome c-type biogenesis protein CcmH [Porticoccaceae bacterium]